MTHILRLWQQPRADFRTVIRVLTLTAGLLVGVVAQAQKAPGNANLPHEQQLQAIRQALLEVTLETTPTQVLSSAWIDGQGALHESHEFHSRAEVRGVRVLSYLNDAEEPRARVSAEVLPWGWRQKETSRASCEPAPRQWRLPMAVTVRMDSTGMPGSQLAAAQATLASAHSSWRESVQHTGHWTVMPWNAPPTSTYLRALMSPSGEDTRRWFATLTLRPAAIEPPAWYADPAAQWHWTLDLQIAQRHDSQSEFQTVASQSFPISVNAQALLQDPGRWLQELRAGLQTRMSHWMAQFEAQTRCEPVQFVVRQEGPAALRLQAGADSGLRAGDRVLLMQPGWVPSRMLDPRAVEHLALAEVVQIGQRHTEIRQLAGPPLAARGEWIAMPL